MKKLILLLLFIPLVFSCGKSINKYKNGKPDGLWIDYYKNGQIEWERTYTNGNLDGLSKWYYSNGQLKSETPYLTDGFNSYRDGLCKSFYENGYLKTEGMYKIKINPGDKTSTENKEGLWKEYNENGQLDEEITYENGIMNGLFRKYKDGRLFIEGPWKNGKAEGNQRAYNPDGSLFGVRTYKNGELVNQIKF